MTGPRSPLGGPADDLLLAYRGTAYFLRWLAQLPEHAYDDSTGEHTVGVRRRTIAAVGYDARGWARLAEEVREGRVDPVTFGPGERQEALELGATQPPRALRHLVEHSAVHLRVEWRDLPAQAWAASGRDDRGRPLRMTDTPWLRACQTWISAVDLGTGASFSDFPASLVDRLLAEVGVHHEPGGGPARAERDGIAAVGAPADVLRWLIRGGESGLRLAAMETVP
ncbi:maleylpyruvate isomerase N-terminal domain-containing protein [Microbacterium insulae]|uniref:Maleylpyruvate isomerase N-terminal domain-containing protein n=1 Tax=Microbacterium insulae TaxID=483014 RepID=A0ABW3AHS4_9MICO